MEKMKSGIWFSGPVMSIDVDDISPELLSDLIDCSGPGDASDAVEYVLNRWDIGGEPLDCAAMLYGYGPWDKDDLRDHKQNLRRLVWLSACGIAEEGEAYFERTTSFSF